MLRFQEYINIIYKSGCTHSDADSLSRKTISELIMDRNDKFPFNAPIDNYGKEQQMYKQLQFIIRALKRGEACQNYQLRNGTLYKRNYDPMGQQ